MAGACRAHGRSGTPHAGGRLIALGRCAAEVGGEGAAGDEDAATGEEGGGVAGESRAHGRGDSALITGWFIDFGGGAAGEGAEGVADEEAAAVGEADWLTRGEPMGVAVHQTRWEGSRGWRGRCAEPSRPIVTRTSPGGRGAAARCWRNAAIEMASPLVSVGVCEGREGRSRRTDRPPIRRGTQTMTVEPRREPFHVKHSSRTLNAGTNAGGRRGREADRSTPGGSGSRAACSTWNLLWGVGVPRCVVGRRERRRVPREARDECPPRDRDAPWAWCLWTLGREWEG